MQSAPLHSKTLTASLIPMERAKKVKDLQLKMLSIQMLNQQHVIIQQLSINTIEGNKNRS